MHENKAPDHNGVQSELYKQSKWSRAELRRLLKRVWEEAQFPAALITGVITTHFKSDNSNNYHRYHYHIIVIFLDDYKIFATILLLRILSECEPYLCPWNAGFRKGRCTLDNHYITKQLYRSVCSR